MTYTDFKKRCARDMEVDGLSCVVVRYGQSAKDANGEHNDMFYDMPSPYAELSVGGRRPGNPIEEEWKRRRHHFNKRIMTDEERREGQTQAARAKYGPPRALVPGDRDEGDVVARDGAGGARSAEEAEAAARSAGRGDRGASEVAVEIDGENNKEVTT